MGKIALLVSREEMLHQAHNILQEKRFRIHEMKVIRTESAVMEARQSIADGASIIIARGLQASLIKQYTDIPVVEIVLTAQEMALLVMKARQIVDKPRPVIAVVGFQNMFCDMSFFDELYGIELRTYFVKQGSQLPDAARAAIADGVDLMIGGDTVVSIAAENGTPSLFQSMTEDSLRQAFSMAESVEYAMDVERKTTAQMETLLDYSFSGIIQLDRDGIITGINPLMEDIMGKSQEEIKGQPVLQAIPQIGEHALRQVLEQGKEYSLFLEWGQVSVFAVMAPVLYEDRVDGAIITCHRAVHKTLAGEKKGTKGPSGPLPLIQFGDLLQESRAMQECIRLAKLYAVSQHPVVLRGEAGTERRMLAECIHNSSRRSQGPFLDVPCDGLSGEEQRQIIFGERGAVMQSQGGTLLIQDAQELTAANQYRLYQLIRFHVLHGTDIAQLRKADVRVMVTVGCPLQILLARGKLRPDLYYLLSGLELQVPSFKDRKEDLERKLEDALRESCDRYARFHVLTRGARELLMQYPWPGNLLQIESFCDRLVLTAGKRTLDEVAVKSLLAELYSEESWTIPADCPEQIRGAIPAGCPKQILGTTQTGCPGQPDKTAANSTLNPASGIPAVNAGSALSPATFYPDPGMDLSLARQEAQRILEALGRNGGSRERTAADLGISKATLWRRMKKLGIR